jgi:hypothetical protein
MRFFRIAAVGIVSSSLAVLATCASQQQLIETPIAQTKYVSGEAPAASTDDQDRDGLIRTFDDMWVTQRAYEQAREEGPYTPPPLPPEPEPAPTPDEITPPAPVLTPPPQTPLRG